MGPLGVPLPVLRRAWEVRDRPLAVHGNGPAAARSALVLSGWSNDVLLCTDGPADLNGMDTALRSAGVQIRQEPIRKLIGHEGRLDRIEFLNGPAERREALFVRTDREQPNGLAEALGCDLGDGGTIETDVDGRTAIPGIYAAGDAATDHSAPSPTQSDPVPAPRTRWRWTWSPPPE